MSLTKQIDFARFYWMSDADIKSALQAKPAIRIDKVAVHGGEAIPQGPLVFRQFLGSKPKDLIGTGYAGIYLLSAHVIDVFCRNEFTGWATYPVEVYGKAGERIEGYHGFSVTGRCGPIDDSKSEKVLCPPPSPEGNPYWALKGIFFDPASWDGSDIFSPEGVTLTIVTEPVRNALEQAKVSNIDFEPLTEFERWL